MIYIIREKATPEQIKDMLQMLQTYIKLAVDIERGILAGGGAMHADCESVLLDDEVNKSLSGERIGILPLNK